MTRCIILSVWLLCASCSGPYVGKNVFGADEFVLDSYKIREGKWAILELEGKNPEELDENLLVESKDLIGEGDVLQIVVYHPKRTDIAHVVEHIGGHVGYQVRQGQIHLPDMPPIEIVGLTLEEVQAKLERLYHEQIPGMEVFVSYKEHGAGKVELIGQVECSSVVVNGRMRLFDVLAKARIAPGANLFKSYVVRDGILLSVDLNQLVKEGDMQQNIVMRAGDKIYIAEASAASLMVMGEVTRERSIPLPSGFMSLRLALAEAGGIPYTGDKSYIQVIRGNIAKPKIYTLSWEHLIHLPNDSLLLMPGDIVYVAAKPITEWNRFISQLLPSFTGFDLMFKNASSWGIVVP